MRRAISRDQRFAISDSVSFCFAGIGCTAPPLAPALSDEGKAGADTGLVGWPSYPLR